MRGSFSDGFSGYFRTCHLNGHFSFLIFLRPVGSQQVTPLRCSSRLRGEEFVNAGQEPAEMGEVEEVQIREERQYRAGGRFFFPTRHSNCDVRVTHNFFNFAGLSHGSCLSTDVCHFGLFSRLEIHRVRVGL